MLGGKLSALDGVRPEDLGIDTLIARVSGGEVDEVVLAMNATLDGQTTAHYLAERLESHPVRNTQLAHGLPVGGELEYVDESSRSAYIPRLAAANSTIWMMARWPRRCAPGARSLDP